MSGPTRRTSPPEETDAVRAYKDVIGELDEAAAALHERGRRQAETLRRRLDELATAAADAEKRAALARIGAELQWDAVLDRLWHEQWMTLRPHPQPDLDAAPDDLDALVVAVERAADAVLEASRKRAFGFGSL